jgi:hypothetical protein
MKFLLLAAFPVMLCAQWPDYPTAGIPRNPDGKAKMDAPTPRTADGKVDFSGVWQLGRGGGGGGRGGAGGAGRGAAAAGRGPAAAGTGAPATPPPPPPVPDLKPGEIPNATFFNIGAGFKEGLPLQPWAAELLQKRKGENSKDNPDAHCLPLGLMQLH